jgi:hypothetical protein
VELISLAVKEAHQVLIRLILKGARPFLPRMVWVTSRKLENSVSVSLQASPDLLIKLRSASKERKRSTRCRLMTMKSALRPKMLRRTPNRNLKHFARNRSVNKSARQLIVKLHLSNLRLLLKERSWKIKFYPTVLTSKSISNRLKPSLNLAIQPREISI